MVKTVKGPRGDDYFSKRIRVFMCQYTLQGLCRTFTSIMFQGANYDQHKITAMKEILM